MDRGAFLFIAALLLIRLRRIQPYGIYAYSRNISTRVELDLAIRTAIDERVQFIESM